MIYKWWPLCLLPSTHSRRIWGLILPTANVNPVRFLSPQINTLRLTGLLDVLFLAKICSMEVTSSECLSEVRTLLSRASNITAARSLQGNEAQVFVDFLDQVSKLSASCLDPTAQRIECRFLHSNPSRTNSGSEVYYCSPRSAKTAASYPARISFERK